MKLYCATSNPGKLREFRLASDWIEPLPGLASVPPCEEPGTTFVQNASIKAQYYGALTEGLLFADDSGIEVDGLGGAPGVLSARFAGPSATDQDNNRALLEKMVGVVRRTARFVCVIALSSRGRVLQTFRGEVEGQVLHAARGANGFGYDPLFFYPPFGCSFGEVLASRKFAVSHRGRAVRAMLDWVRSDQALHQRD